MCSWNSWNRICNSTTILLVLFYLACSGCARKPWTDPLDEKQAENTIQFLKSLNSRAETCQEGIDGDISLFYRNIFEKKSVNGYFQILSPSFIKLIVSNPLGQPILVVTSDQHTFQLITTLERRYITGRVSSYGLLHNIPPALLRGDWVDWIRGTVRVDPSTITDIRRDRENRGTWVTVQTTADNILQKTHMLIDSGEGDLLSRRIENAAGKILAEITYEDWMPVGYCRQPYTINITGLEYNSTLAVKLSHVLIAENLNRSGFRLTAPANYVRQILP